MSVLLLCMFLYYQHDGFNIFFSSFHLWFWIGFSCWTCVDVWSFLMSFHFMAQVASVQSWQFWQCPSRKFFSHFLFYFLPLITSSTNCNLIYRDYIVLNPTISPEYFFYFQKAKTDKTMSDNHISGVSLNHFLPFLILLVPFILH